MDALVKKGVEIINDDNIPARDRILLMNKFLDKLAPTKTEMDSTVTVTPLEIMTRLVAQLDGSNEHRVIEAEEIAGELEAGEPPAEGGDEF